MLNRKSILFLLLAYGLAWLIALTFFAAGGEINTLAYTLTAVVIMWTPGVAAIVVQKVVHKAPLRDLGLKLRFNRWLVVAALLPLLFVLLALPLSTLMPGAEWADPVVSLQQQLAAAGEDAAPLQAVADQIGPLFGLLLLGGMLFSAVLAGLSINMLAALGEEIGWRGLLWQQLRGYGFWRASFVSGILWGAWHWPLIWHGHNYAQHPRAGLLLMVLFTLLLTPLHGYVRDKSDTLLAPAIMHGTINATAAIIPLYVSGGSDLTVNLTGAAGLLALLLLNGALWLRMRAEADTSQQQISVRTVASPTVK